MSQLDSIFVESAKIKEIIGDLRLWMGKYQEHKLTQLYQFVTDLSSHNLEPSFAFKIFCACIDVISRLCSVDVNKWQPLLTKLVSHCVNLREKDLTTLEKV